MATEAAPLSVCSQCGDPMPQPNGTATFVYGVGAVGYQHCAACGAKWRYLWRDPVAARVTTGRGRLLAIVGGGALVAVVVAGVALARSQNWNTSGASKASHNAPVATTPKNVAGTKRPTRTTDAAVAADYLGIVRLNNGLRAAFMGWLASTAPSTPQYLVDERVNSFVRTARRGYGALTSGRWPDNAAADINKLVTADRAFVDDVDLIRFGLLYSPSYMERLTAEVQAVRDADNVVRRDLLLPPAAQRGT